MERDTDQAACGQRIDCYMAKVSAAQNLNSAEQPVIASISQPHGEVDYGTCPLGTAALPAAQRNSSTENGKLHLILDLPELGQHRDVCARHPGAGRSSRSLAQLLGRDQR